MSTSTELTNGVEKASHRDQVTIEGRLHRHIPNDSHQPESISVLLLRNGDHFTRAIVRQDRVGLDTLREAQQLAPETLLRVHGSLDTPSDHSATTIDVRSWEILSKAKPGISPGPLPHNAPGEVPRGTAFDPRVFQERLDNRVLDVRVPSSAAVVKLFSAVFELAVEHLAALDFWRIPTPSLIGWEFPGDEYEQFSLDYFGRERAWLSQTGDVHLEMALAADLERVYDVHTVFRQEAQADSRHLTEFTTLDIMWAFKHDWTEIMEFSEKFIIFITESLHGRDKYSRIVEQARRLYPDVGKYKLGLDANGRLPRVTFAEAKRTLRDVLGLPADDSIDVTHEEEAALGRFLASEESTFGPPTDVFFLTHFPRHVRPYNVYASRDDEVTTHSVDIIMRGEEIATGYQCIHDYAELRHAMDTRRHPIDGDSKAWQPFVEAHELGMPPLGGIAIGLNRFLKGFLSAASIQETVIFPRDSSRLRP